VKRIPRGITLFIIGAVIAFTGLGIASVPLAEKAIAAGCASPSIGFGRWKWCGYWYNKYDPVGDSVRIGGVPGHVNTAQEFIDLMKSDMNSGNANWNTGARFVMRTMIGAPMPWPALGVGSFKPVSAGEVADFESRVRTYANISENGTTSFGSNGRIEWFTVQHTPCGIVNTYWQDGYNDVAPYIDEPGNSDCELPWYTSDFIIFRDNAGNEVYMIRRLCMNPMGRIGPLDPTPPPDFNLTPAIGTSVNGSAGSVAQVGDTVRFTYTVNNSGSTSSTNVNCSTYATTYAGYHAGGSAPPGGSPLGPSPGCPRSFGVGSTSVATEDVPIVTANQSICRTLSVDPYTITGGSRSTNEVCVVVANKPYLKVFGGDISVGNGLSTSIDVCTNYNNAAVMAWNERGAGGYSGAGAQYATYALRRITDFSTAQGNAGGAPVPAGLAFANTSINVASGDFGGTFGSVTCIPDYWSRKPASTSTLPANVSAMTTGAYAASGTTTLTGGNVNPGQKTSVYIDGDVYINSNITYPGNWQADRVPLFQLVVRGNIFISGAVTQLDGVYIAQRSSGAGGQIYTCATGASAPTLTNGAFYNGCTNKLTINGVFVANSVEFLRTGGTLSQSSVGESTGSNSASEVFNFSPLLWMTQPLDTSGRVDNYDSIISLPPVL
jgi:hypothetical protein